MLLCNISINTFHCCFCELEQNDLRAYFNVHSDSFYLCFNKLDFSLSSSSCQTDVRNNKLFGFITILERRLVK